LSKSLADEPRRIDINVRATGEVAWNLTQLCKRSTFNQFYELTEARLLTIGQPQKRHGM
jgi:hypothetical protein